VNQDRQSNREFSREKIRGVSMPPPPYKVPLSSPKPADQPGHYSAVAVCRLPKPHY
jgi:hypothetical protein